MARKMLRCGCVIGRHRDAHNQLPCGDDEDVCELGWRLPPAVIDPFAPPCANWADHVWVQQANGYYRCSKCPFEKSAGEIAYMDRHLDTSSLGS